MPSPQGFSESDLLISPTQLAQTLGKRIDDFWSVDPLAPNAVWTAQVKRYFGDIAAELNVAGELKVLYTNVEPGEREFMCDVVWWLKPTGGGESMALAAEVEWGSWSPKRGVPRTDYVRDCVGEDFGKLTVLKCPLKVMVFCTDKGGASGDHGIMRAAVLDEIDRYLTSYGHHLPGEHYVLIDVATKGCWKAWIRSVDAAGSISSLQEVPMVLATSTETVRDDH